MEFRDGAKGQRPILKPESGDVPLTQKKKPDSKGSLGLGSLGGAVKKL